MVFQTALLLLLTIQFAAATGVAGSSVAIIIKSDNHVPPAVVAAMKNEVERSLASAGLQFLWESYADQGSQSYPEVVVVTLSGHCYSDPAGDSSLPARTL